MGQKRFPCLEPVAPVAVDLIQRFVVLHHFNVDTSDSAQVKIAHLGSEFTMFLLGKVEDNSYMCVGELRMSQLTRRSSTLEILSELFCPETMLMYLYSLLSRQGRGEEGPLLTNGFANVFYIRDLTGKLVEVTAHWRDGWCINVERDVERARNSRGFDPGVRVFSA